LNVDTVFNTRSSLVRRLVRQLTLDFTLRGVTERNGVPIPIGPVPCDRLDGARLLRPRLGDAATYESGGLIVGTARMGYGHHRIARSVVTCALDRGATPYVHDVLEINSPEADSIRRMDQTYSRFSRWAAQLGGFADRLWGALMTGGGIESLRFFCALAERLTPLMEDLPRDLPVLCTHPLNAQIAVACGFKRVINLVIDNYPQHFVLAPGALNLVQGPACELGLRQLGIPNVELRTVGHWTSADLLNTLEDDCSRRIDRAEGGHPTRILIPIGGAGAQAHFVSDLIRRLAPLVRAGRARLLLNSGDHQALRPRFTSLFQTLGLETLEIKTWSELLNFRDATIGGGALPAATLFAFERYDHGFAATDHLIRCADLLVTKPSELAFAPAPKLHIRRVGGHEAASALRSAELGDGTPEQRTAVAAASSCSQFIDTPRLLADMNVRILGLGQAGVYSGSRRAVEIALADPPSRLSARRGGRFTPMHPPAPCLNNA
jgi:hypothetical protein